MLKNILPIAEHQKSLDSAILLEGITHGVAVFDENLILQNWNDQFYQIFLEGNYNSLEKVSFSEVLLHNIDSKGAHEEHSIALSIINELSKAENISDLFAFNYEYQQLNEKHYRVAGKIIENFGVIITLADITGRKQAEFFQRDSTVDLNHQMFYPDDNNNAIMEQQATEAIRMAEELAIAREEFELSAIHTQAILDAMAEGLVTIDEFGHIQTMNNAIKEIFGYELEDIKGTEILNLFKTTRFSSTEDLIGYIKSTEKREYKAKETAIRKDKTEFPIELSIREIYLGSKREFTVLFRDITERAEAEKLIHHMALQDSLTGLANRNLLKKRLDENLKTARRNKTSIAVMFLDLDNFKPVNDLYGHGVGDKLLQIVSQRLLAAARETDTVARLGGDEFAIVLTNIDDINAISTIAERILTSIQEPVIIDDKTLQIGTSIGVSFYPDDSLDPDELIRMADVALYKAKEAGRRTYRLYDSKMDSNAKQEKLIITELAQAIDKNELELYYQPQVDSKSLEIVGVEALIRWLHPQRGMVPPDSFISSAESSGLIHPIGQWVLDTACIQTKKWQDQGLPKFKICINISARQFQAKDFLGTVKSAIQKSGLSPEYIELEITEGMVIDDTETMITKLQDIAALGISLSIDDFGTGYSSLAYLKRFPVNQLKIDQSFIHDILNNRDDAAITDAVIQLGHSLSMTVVGEGVETVGQVKLLREKGCDILQGYYFSRPIPQDNFGEWIINYTPEMI